MELESKMEDKERELHAIRLDNEVVRVVFGMLTPYARIGRPSVSGGGFLGSLQKMYADLPSSVFEAERPGCKFSVKQRIATYFFKGVLYGAVGFGCGLIGQGIANLIMTAKRSISKSEEDILMSPLVKSPALWVASRYLHNGFFQHQVSSHKRARTLCRRFACGEEGSTVCLGLYRGCEIR